MTTWRDKTSQLAQDDLDDLQEFALNEGARLLAGHGGFTPFAAVVSAPGELTALASLAKEGQSSSADALDTTFASLRSIRDDLRAVVVASDIRLRAGGNAMDFHLEHREGRTLLVRAPYRLTSQSLDIENRIVGLDSPNVWIGQSRATTPPTSPSTHFSVGHSPQDSE